MAGHILRMSFSLFQIVVGLHVIKARPSGPGFCASPIRDGQIQRTMIMQRITAMFKNTHCRKSLGRRLTSRLWFLDLAFHLLPAIHLAGMRERWAIFRSSFAFFHFGSWGINQVRTAMPNFNQSKWPSQANSNIRTIGSQMCAPSRPTILMFI